MLKFPPLIVTVPFEAVSPSSGSDLRASPPEVMSKSPPLMVTLPSKAIPLFTAVALIVPLSTVRELSAAPLIAFLALPTALSVPSPKIVSEEPD